ncbi:MAG: hypothetical protein IKF79_05665, partial [Methanosphaera sp.]|nr:hypothetical protein [Methanosphaera sp.]
MVSKTIDSTSWSTRPFSLLVPPLGVGPSFWAFQARPFPRLDIVAWWSLSYASPQHIRHCLLKLSLHLK